MGARQETQEGRQNSRAIAGSKLTAVIITHDITNYRRIILPDHDPIVSPERHITHPQLHLQHSQSDGVPGHTPTEGGFRYTHTN